MSEQGREADEKRISMTNDDVTTSVNHTDPAITDTTLQGTHTFTVRSEVFVVDCKYEPIKRVGCGAYGVVCSCLNRLSNKKVAIKKVPRAFDDLIDAKRVLREVKIMQRFDHKNVVGLRDMIPPGDSGPFEDVYVVMDLMESDLHKIIYSTNTLTDDHVRYFVYQILNGLKYVHSANVIHRDIKPSNMLVNGNCELKICDFGLARSVGGEDETYDLTEYVMTRWYRAPEVMLTCDKYDAKVDVWSVGCIMAELIGRKPLFPGEDQLEQMKIIFNTLGTPTPEETKFVSNPDAREFIANAQPRDKVPFSTVFPHIPAEAADLLENLLKFNPNERISVDDALRHPFFDSFNERRRRHEKTCEHKIDFQWERGDLTRGALQDLMWEEIQTCRPYLRDRERPQANNSS